MPKIVKSQAFKTIAIYTADGFTIDRKNDTDGDELYAPLKESPYTFLYESAFSKLTDCDTSILYLAEIAERVIEAITRNPDVDITRIAPAPDDEMLFELLRKVPYVHGSEFVNVLWIKEVYNKIADVFNAEFAAHKGTCEEYIKSKNSGLNVAGKVYFHLVEAKEEDYPFAFLATYSDGNKGKVNHVPLKNALEKTKKSKAKTAQSDLLALLSAVSRVADKSDFVSELIESGELFSPLKFSPQEAYTFLRETPLYEESGVICRIPNFWKKKYNTRVKVSVGGKEPSAVGLQELIAFSPSIYLGDEAFSEKEIKALLNETSGLAFLKGKWVEVDHEKLQSALTALEQFGDKDISLADAIRMQSGLSDVDGLREDESAEIEITNGEWLSTVINQMLQPDTIKQKKPGTTFKADLRQYQTVGFNWLNFMIKSRFGALLADDMGLGKTVQILALLDSLRKSKIKTLLVIPASLIQNWRKEAAKFTPKLQVKILHGSESTELNTDDGDLFVTTYGMVARLETLKEVEWDLLILDEAQAIKNHGNKQTKAVKALTAKAKIAMTGTPVENRLADLWSIFDFLNKGLLGTAKEFGDFTKSLKENTAGYEKLRGAVSPFILRRLKTDKSIISDLPDKMESLQYTTLTKKQIALYNQLVKELQHAMEDDEVTAMQRRAMILTSIMKFKQICNHPDQYLGNDKGEFAPKHSGKFETLEEICKTIADKRERVLVFTQFREMTQPIADFLASVFEQTGLILHGGTSVKKRGELVEKFNGDEYVPFMVLSLKAGGVGLNLTSANHVIHFDRWWNPAIENQATDRAFRIGQTKNVNVYKFVTTGTIEEKIDTVISGKQALAGEVIEASSGEKWITEMGNDELMNLFRLEV